MHSETNEIEELAILASCYRAELEMHADELLARLETQDPEFVSRVIAAIGDRHVAALWMIWSNRVLGGVSPLRIVANGNRQAVLNVLGRIEQGVLS